MRCGEVLYLQRASPKSGLVASVRRRCFRVVFNCEAHRMLFWIPRMRAIGHLAVQNYAPSVGDFIIRRGNKYPITGPPLPTPDDIVLPLQWYLNGSPLSGTL